MDEGAIHEGPLFADSGHLLAAKLVLKQERPSRLSVEKLEARDAPGSEAFVG